MSVVEGPCECSDVVAGFTHKTRDPPVNTPPRTAAEPQSWGFRGPVSLSSCFHLPFQFLLYARRLPLLGLPRKRLKNPPESRYCCSLLQVGRLPGHELIFHSFIASRMEFTAFGCDETIALGEQWNRSGEKYFKVFGRSRIINLYVRRTTNLN